MENRNWIPGGTFFKPAPLGLSIEELEERARRESSANHESETIIYQGVGWFFLKERTHYRLGKSYYL